MTVPTLRHIRRTMACSRTQTSSLTTNSTSVAKEAWCCWYKLTTHLSFCVWSIVGFLGTALPVQIQCTREHTCYCCVNQPVSACGGGAHILSVDLTCSLCREGLPQNNQHNKKDKRASGPRCRSPLKQTRMLHEFRTQTNLEMSFHACRFTRTYSQGQSSVMVVACAPVFPAARRPYPTR